MADLLRHLVKIRRKTNIKTGPLRPCHLTANPALNAIIMEFNGQGAHFGFDENALRAKMADLGFAEFPTPHSNAGWLGSTTPRRRTSFWFATRLSPRSGSPARPVFPHSGTRSETSLARGLGRERGGSAFREIGGHLGMPRNRGDCGLRSGGA